LTRLSSFLTPSLLNDPPPPNSSPLSLHDALPIFLAERRELRPRLGRRASKRPAPSGSAPRWRRGRRRACRRAGSRGSRRPSRGRSEEHTSELQSLTNLVCRLLLEKKKKNI